MSLHAPGSQATAFLNLIRTEPPAMLERVLPELNGDLARIAEAIDWEALESKLNEARLEASEYAARFVRENRGL